MHLVWQLHIVQMGEAAAVGAAEGDLEEFRRSLWTEGGARTLYVASELAAPLGQGPLASDDSTLARSRALLGVSLLPHEVAQRTTVPHGEAVVDQTELALGFAARPIDNDAIVAAALACSSGNSEVGGDVSCFLDFMMRGDRPPVMSSEALGLLADIDRKKIPSISARCAQALFGMARARLSRMESFLSSALPRSALLHFVEAVSYDETEMTVRLACDPARAQRAQAPAPSGSSETLAVRDRESAMCKIEDKSRLSVFSSQAPQKIMQTRSDISMTIRVGSRALTLTFIMPIPLCVLETGSASNVEKQQIAVSPVSRVELAFGSVTRAACTDGAAPNLAAERAISRRRGLPRAASLHLLCGVHCTALVYNKTMAPLDSDVSSAIQTALSLRNGAAMSRFRRALRQEIESRLDIKEGYPSPDATRYKKMMLRVFSAPGDTSDSRRALLAMIPNGDWRSAKVEYLVRPGGPFKIEDRDDILQHLVDGLTLALAASQPSVYNRSKWCGSDVAVNDLGLFEGVHRLLSTTYARFCAGYMQSATAKMYLDAAEVLRFYDAKPDLQVLDQDQGGGEPEIGPSAQTNSFGGGAPSNASSGAAQEGANAWAIENASRRRKAMSWIRQGCLGPLILLRTLMEPLRQYLAVQFHHASMKWDLREQGKVAVAQESGHIYTRQLRVVSVAEGSYDHAFEQHVKILFNADPETCLWQVMPPSCHTVTQRALAFRCVSRIGCAFRKLLSSRHRRFPIRMFLLLAKPDLATPTFAQMRTSV